MVAGASTAGRDYTARPRDRAREAGADQQDVVVGVPGRQHLRLGRAERAAAVDVLEPGAWRAARSVRVQAPRGAHERRRLTSPPKTTGRAAAWRARITLSSAHWASLPATSFGRAGVQVRGADVDVARGRHAQPSPPLEAGLGLEGLVVGALDRRLGEHGVAEEPAAARAHALEELAAVGDLREARVVAGPAGDQRDVALARLVDRHRVGARLPDPGRRLVHHGRVGRLAVAPGQAGEAQVHLHQGVARGALGRPAAARQGEHEQATHPRGPAHRSGS